MRNLQQTFFIVCSCASLLNGFAQTQGAPEFIRANNQEYPIWVSSRVAMKKATLDLNMFSEAKSRSLALFFQSEAERLRSGGVDDCGTLLNIETSYVQTKPSDKMEDLFRYAEGIISGVIQSVETGFVDGDPSSLVTLKVDRVEKGPIKLESTVYIAYPSARFKFGGAWLCREDDGVPVRAVPGNRMQMFIYPQCKTEIEHFFMPDPKFLVVEDDRGTAMFSSRMPLPVEQKTKISFDNWLRYSVKEVVHLENSLQK